jgi:hypothetical protein
VVKPFRCSNRKESSRHTGEVSRSQSSTSARSMRSGNRGIVKAETFLRLPEVSANHLFEIVDADRYLRVEGIWMVRGPIGALIEEIRFAGDSPVEGDGFELVWGFSCQAVIFWLLLRVLCSEREGRSSSRRLRSGSRSARKGSRDRNASAAWRLAA